MSQPGYVLAARAQLALSPRLQQAVRLLQMSSIDFAQEMRHALETNPFLEETGDPLDETDAESIEPAGHEATASDPERQSPTLTVEDTATAFEHEGPGPLSDPLDGLRPASATRTDRGAVDPLGWISAPTGLRDHLRSQAAGSGLSPRQHLAVEIVIDTLDDDGYLRQRVADSAEALALPAPFTAAELDAAIAEVQQFEPVGVAARSLGECLSLQLRVMASETPGRALALRLVESHLAEVAARNDGALAHRLGCHAGALAEALQLVRRLDPRPAERFRGERINYVVPDVIVTLHQGRLVTRINPAVLPRARLDQHCVSLLRRSREGRYPAMRQQLQEARWLLKNAEQRHVTIQRVAEAVVRRQRAFFAYGDVALRPLGLQEVADELGLHESTVSRATGNKYLATPRGTFEFKHFFSRTLATDTGGSCSASAVRALIRELIDTENPRAPMSDVVLAKRLGQQGICVARRTVTKYRQQMRLPAVETRRQSAAA